jgi:hypothetical protein
MGGFIDKMPIRMLIHGMVVLIISSHIKINFSLAKQSTIIPEGIDEL